MIIIFFIQKYDNSMKKAFYSSSNSRSRAQRPLNKYI